MQKSGKQEWTIAGVWVWEAIEKQLAGKREKGDSLLRDDGGKYKRERNEG